MGYQTKSPCQIVPNFQELMYIGAGNGIRPDKLEESLSGGIYIRKHFGGSKMIASYVSFNISH